MKVLITQTAFLGDVVILTALIRECHNIFENCSIDVLVCPPAHNLLKNNPYINEVLVFDKKKNRRSSFSNNLRRIRSRKYDVSLNAHSSLTSIMFSVLGGIPERIGFNRRFSRFFLTKKIPFVKGKKRVLKNLDLLSPFKKNIENYQTELFPSKADNEKAKNYFVNDETFKGNVVVFPGSVWNTKRWSKDYYVELIKMLNSANVNVILSGSAGERDLCSDIIDNSGINCRNLAGDCTLLETAAVINNANAVVCNDSGALHIANAMQTDAVVFFGPTVESLGYFPLGKNDVVLETDLDCRPCGLHGSKECPLKHHNCMKLIKPDEAFSRVMSLLNRNRKIKDEIT